MHQALGACRGIWVVDGETSSRFSAKHWITLFNYLWFTFQIRFKILAFASFFGPKDNGAENASPG
jgi:hypothetical protein